MLSVVKKCSIKMFVIYCLIVKKNGQGALKRGGPLNKFHASKRGA